MLKKCNLLYKKIPARFFSCSFFCWFIVRNMERTCGRLVLYDVNQRFFPCFLKRTPPFPHSVEALTEPGRGETGEEEKKGLW